MIWCMANAWASSADVAIDVPPPLAFTETERAHLDAGAIVFRAEEGSELSLAAVVLDASPDAIWDAVLGFDQYVDFLPYVTKSIQTGTWTVDEHQVIDAEFELTTRGVVTRYDIRHAVWRDRGYALFHLLPNSPGPLSEVNGVWRVEQWSDGRQLLSATIDARANWFIPAFIRTKATDRALPTAVKLIGRRVSP